VIHRRADQQFTVRLVGFIQGMYGIYDQVQHDLLQLGPVSFN
jgi:hypothetical protein